jgi:hypothetical protein
VNKRKTKIKIIFFHTHIYSLLISSIISPVPFTRLLCTPLLLLLLSVLYFLQLLLLLLLLFTSMQLSIESLLIDVCDNERTFLTPLSVFISFLYFCFSSNSKIKLLISSRFFDVTSSLNQFFKSIGGVKSFIEF